MKKQMAALLSVSLAGAMCVGIAACGFGSAQSGGQQFSADTFDASWAAAFDEANFENFKATWRTDYFLKFSGPRPEDWEEMGPESMAETATIVCADGREYWVGDMDDGTTEETYYYDGHIYTKEYGNWTASESQPLVSQILELFAEPAEEGEKFTYDAKKGYVLTTSEQHTMPGGEECELVLTLTFVFKNGKISHFVYDQLENYTDDGYTVEYVYDIDFTYGGQKVTFPEGFPVDEGGGQASQTGGKLPEANFEEAWAAAFAESNFENLKLNLQMRLTMGSYSSNAMTIDIVRAGNAENIVQVVSGHTIRYYYDGENTYAQEEEGGDWSIHREVATTVAILGEYVTPFADDAGKAEYSEELGGYVVEGVFLYSEDVSEDAPIIPTTNVFVFKDGKIVKLTQTFHEEESDADYLITIEFTYGGQTVTPPALG